MGNNCTPKITGWLFAIILCCISIIVLEIVWQKYKHDKITADIMGNLQRSTAEVRPLNSCNNRRLAGPLSIYLWPELVWLVGWLILDHHHIVVLYCVKATKIRAKYYFNSISYYFSL